MTNPSIDDCKIKKFCFGIKFANQNYNCYIFANTRDDAEKFVKLSLPYQIVTDCILLNAPINLNIKRYIAPHCDTEIDFGPPPLLPPIELINSDIHNIKLRLTENPSISSRMDLESRLAVLLTQLKQHVRRNQQLEANAQHIEPPPPKHLEDTNSKKVVEEEQTINEPVQYIL